MGAPRFVIELVTEPVPQDPASALTHLSQSGTKLSATLARQGTCQTPGGQVSYGELHAFSDGSVVSDEISFDTPTCQFKGTFSGNPPDAMEGSVTCSIPEPSAFMTWSCLSSFARSDEKATRCLSGDQAGAASREEGLCVRRCCSVASGSVV